MPGAKKITPADVIGQELPENLLRFNEALQPAWFISAWYTDALFQDLRQRRPAGGRISASRVVFWSRCASECREAGGCT